MKFVLIIIYEYAIYSYMYIYHKVQYASYTWGNGTFPIIY